MAKRVLHKIDRSFVVKYCLDKSLINKEIVLYDNQISHLERHKNDYSSIEAYTDAFNNIDSIVRNPDFISINNKNNSLEFVKRINDCVLVAVRVSDSSSLKVRTMYPINKIKFEKLKKSVIFVSNSSEE